MDDIMSMKTFAKQLNDLTFTDYYKRLMLLARSVFKWEGLPNGMDERWIEDFLFHHGRCVFFKDENRGFMVAECAEDGDLNNYRDPVSVSPTGLDVAPQSLLVNEECVLIRNNDIMIPTSRTLKLFAYRLAEISRTIDVNVNAQKTPYVIAGINKQLLTLKNIMSKVEQNELAIYVDKTLDLETIKVLKLDAPIVFPQLQEQKQCMWNECLTFLGINNANTDKRERLITDEVRANNDHIDLSADCMLKARQTAADQINHLFGTEITVRLRREDEEQCMHDTQSISVT